MSGNLIRSLTQITQARLINLRWLSVLAMFAAALLSQNIIGSGDLMPRLLAFATFIACVNACMQLAVVFSRVSSTGLPMLSPFIQLFFDLASWGSYIYLSGGATNPLISIFLPLVAIGAIVLGRLQAWFLGIAAIATYTFLWRFYQPLNIVDAQTATRLHLLGMWLVFVVSAIVVIWFILQMTQAIRQRDTALAEAREQTIRNDWLISMGSLAAGAAHELSTPLGTLNILIDDWLEGDQVLDTQRPDLELMRRQVDSCKRALSQLTQRAGNPRSDKLEPVAADIWLQGLLGAWQALNPAGNIVLADVSALGKAKLMLSITIERALTNLLDNAVKAGATTILVRAAITPTSLDLQIEDDGPGIAQEAMEAFSAGQPVMSADGMGIGLLLARTAVERVGGKLALQRLPEGGTRACVSLPFHDAKEN